MGFGVVTAGIVIALTAPILGAIADTSGTHALIWVFSVLYVIGSAGIWIAARMTSISSWSSSSLRLA